MIHRPKEEGNNKGKEKEININYIIENLYRYR